MMTDVPTIDLQGNVTDDVHSTIARLLLAAVDRALNVAPIVSQITAKVCRRISLKAIPKRTGEWSKERHPESWRANVEASVRKLVTDKSDVISRLVAERLK